MVPYFILTFEEMLRSEVEVVIFLLKLIVLFCKLLIYILNENNYVIVIFNLY